MGLKDLFNKAKEKVNNALDLSNKEIKKFANTQNVILYSKPVVGGFINKRAFYEDNKLLFPVSEYLKEDVEKHTIIGLNNDGEYYVITSLSEDTIIKEVKSGDKVFTYECYEATYNILNDEFTNDVDGLPFYELTLEQEKILNEIKVKIENRSLAWHDKKEFCLNLWQFFTECIQYRLKDHYIMIAFARIASEYVSDFSTYLIKLFA